MAGSRPPPLDPTPALARSASSSFAFEGEVHAATAGDSLAEALWAAGIWQLGRSPKYHRPRGAFCFSGSCGTCLLRVNGRPNVRACMEPVSAALRCERQNAFPAADVDLLRAADWLFPHGMDHHHLMTGTRVGNALFVKLVREVGGTGVVPDEPDPRFGATEILQVDVCVVGAGPAGLSSAAAVAEGQAGRRVLLLDQRSGSGGSWRSEAGGRARAEAAERRLRALGVDVALASTVFGYFPEDHLPASSPAFDGPPGVLAVLRPQHVTLVSARRFVLATGSYEQNLAFPGNDRPGIVAARACGRLLLDRGIVPARRVTLVMDPAAPWDYGERLRATLDAAGVTTDTVSLAQAPAPRKHHALAIVARPAPAFELPRQFGVEVQHDPARGGFFAAVGPEGRTSVPGVFVAGDACGYVGPEYAEAHGRAVGRCVGSSL
ncbi:MAG: (2Fe-2S)-binding protein [Myxococcales bacterium]|nr:(2Fe-2S)-binding protein [Myxococcales bacterium]